MQCPICSSKLKTVNSRKTNGGASTWRRKSCPNCNIILTSRETLDLSSIIRIGDHPYSRLKLTTELAQVASKSSQDDVSHAVDTIESRLLKLTRHDHKITKGIYTQEILSVLKKLDQPSYLRYLAKLEDN